MTEPRRPQSRMIPVAVAGLVGVLLGALIVTVGVLAGRSAECCCRPPCAVADKSPAPAVTPMLPPAPLWLIPQDDKRQDVPLPGSLMLVAAGGLAWVLRG